MIYQKEIDNLKDSENDKQLNNKSLEENPFNLSQEFKKVFKSQEFYNALVNAEFIFAGKTSFIDFKNVFFINHTKHDSTINFFCDNDLAGYFLKYLSKKKKGQLSQINLGKSKRFKDYDGNNISQYFISRSEKYLKSSEISKVESFIDSYLK